MNTKTLHEKHCKLLDAVNNAKTIREHDEAVIKLNSWREGVKCSGGNISLIDADLYYMYQGIDRPMIGGVFLDWEPYDEH